jgi:cytochrome c556
MKTKRWVLILAASSVLAVAGYFAIKTLTGTAHADDLQAAIDARRALMKENGAQMKAIYAVVDAKSGDMMDMQKRATIVQANAAKIPTLFPSGTSSANMPDKTHAKPEIWQNLAGFKSAAAELGTQAGKLADAAKNGDMAAFAAQFEATAKACGNCHMDFRTKLQ